MLGVDLMFALTRAHGRQGEYRKQLEVGPDRLTMSYLDFPGDDTPIVFIHGAAGCAVQWEEQAQRLAERHRVLVVDLRGHGLSDKPATSYRTEDFMGDLRSFVDGVGLPERFHVVGHSFGGYLAALLAHEMPHRVDKLVLMNTTGDIRHLGVMPRTAVNLPSLILQIVHHAVPVLLSMPPHVGRLLVEEALDEWDCWHLYPEIESRTLVVTGVHDNIAPPAHAERIASLVPDARLNVVQFSRHMTMIERSQPVARLLEQFLSYELAGDDAIASYDL